MAAWGSLKNIFENPLPEPISSWTQLLPKAETETSFDMFGEICHRVKPENAPILPEKPPTCPRPPIPFPDSIPRPRLDKSSSWNGNVSDTDQNAFEIFGELCYKTNPEPNIGDNLTEGLGIESSGGDGGLANGMNGGEKRKKKVIYARSYSDVRPKCNNGLLPPPITSIGRGGKPRVYFKSYREDGRFVLREIRIPTQRLLHATREDGRLRMQVVSPVDDVARRGESDNEDRGEKEEEEDK